MRPIILFCYIIAVVLCFLVCKPAGNNARAAQPGLTAEMQLIPAGYYKPLFRDSSAAPSVAVAAFYLDTYPVSNADFLNFVQENPTWRRSAIKPIFGDDAYLHNWAGDLDLGDLHPQAPVTHVSWFAARAYAKSVNKRLPTNAEWELAASVENFKSDVDDQQTARTQMTQQILSWYSKTTPKRLPAVGANPPSRQGIYDLHGLVWEWVDDFSSALVNGDARGDSDLQRNLFCGAASVRAADVNDYAAFMRYAFRSSLSAKFCVANLGFRCARDLPD